MANAIDPYSYGLGMEHGHDNNVEVARNLAHDLALIENAFRDSEAGHKSLIEFYFETRVVLHGRG